MATKVALITGGNTGIGLACAERLLQAHPGIHLCLACRNKSKAEAARRTLLIGQADADVSILLVDVSNLGSVYKAAKEIKTRYKKLDYLFLNAGIMPNVTVNWQNFLGGLFSSQAFSMIQTGHTLLNQVDDFTSEGLKQVFATNLFGHFVLIRELEDMLGGTSQTTQLIWTSSSNARKEAFKLDDMQHVNGNEPYSASKYAADLVTVTLNERLNKKGVYCHSTCPGLVMTNMTYGIMASWLWYIMLPFLWLLRLLVPSLCLNCYNGAESLIWLSKQNPAGLDPLCKYYSHVSFLGRPYTKVKKMDINLDFARKTYDKLDMLEKEMQQRFKC